VGPVEGTEFGPVVPPPPPPQAETVNARVS